MRPPDRIRVKREPQRGRYDRETIDAILDEGLICHLGFEVDGQPYVIPMLYHYENNTIYIHGQRGGRLPRTLRAGARITWHPAPVAPALATHSRLGDRVRTSGCGRFARAHAPQ